MSHDCGKPALYRGGHRLEVRPQAVVIRHLHDRATRGGWRNAEPVSRTLHDQRRDRYFVELV
jgi:hypothetical protein